MKKTVCKMYTFSKTRHMFEKEEIDEYSKKTSKTAEFVNSFIDTLLSTCLSNLEKDASIVDAGVKH